MDTIVQWLSTRKVATVEAREERFLEGDLLGSLRGVLHHQVRCARVVTIWGGFHFCAPEHGLIFLSLFISFANRAALSVRRLLDRMESLLS